MILLIYNSQENHNCLSNNNAEIIGGVRHMKDDFPYHEFESTKLWGVINQAMFDLVENTDLDEMTDRKYIVGYLCKSLSDAGFQVE